MRLSDSYALLSNDYKQQLTPPEAATTAIDNSQTTELTMSHSHMGAQFLLIPFRGPDVWRTSSDSPVSAAVAEVFQPRIGPAVAAV